MPGKLRRPAVVLSMHYFEMEFTYKPPTTLHGRASKGEMINRLGQFGSTYHTSRFKVQTDERKHQHSQADQLSAANIPKNDQAVTPESLN